MFPEIGKGLGVGIALILVAVTIGHFIGLACSGGDYEDAVDTPEESGYALDVDDELSIDAERAPVAVHVE